MRSWTSVRARPSEAHPNQGDAPVFREVTAMAAADRRYVVMCGAGVHCLAFAPRRTRRGGVLTCSLPLLGLLLGACSLVPHYARPDPAIPPAWSGDANQGLQGTVAVRSGWWRSFGSNELSALEERSLTENYNLKAAIARIEEARGTAEVTGAPLYPALSLNGTLDRSNGRGTDLKTSRTQNVFGLATYEADFWGKNRANAELGTISGDCQPVR